MSQSIQCAACGNSQPVIAGRSPKYCSGCGADLPVLVQQPAAMQPVTLPPLASVRPPPVLPAEHASATRRPSPRKLTTQFVLLAVLCGLLFSLLPLGLASVFIWQFMQQHGQQPVPQTIANASNSPDRAMSDRRRADDSPLAMVTNLPPAGEPAQPGSESSAQSSGSLTALRPLHPATEIEPEETPARRSTDLADLIDSVENSVVRVNVSGPGGGGLGSGFIANADGTVVTNHHVIEGAATAEVIFKDGRKARVRGVRADLADKDVAVLSIEPPSGRPLRPLKIAAGLPRKGEQVVAFGAPLGFSFTASDGLISAIRNGAELNSEFRGIGFNLDYDPRVTWLQTTAPISRGNSGGPLVNLRGEVVGLNTLSIPELGQNLNFAVSAVDLQRAIATAADEPRPLVPSVRQPQRGPGGGGPGKGNAGPRGGRREVVDGVNTPAGRQLLAQLQQVAVAVILDSGDPLRAPRDSQPSVNMIASQCVQSLRAAGLQVVEQPGPDTAILLVRAEFQRRMNTSFSCSMGYTLLERGAPNQPLVRTWVLDREVQFDSRYPTQVKRIAGDVKSAIRALASAVRDARQHVGNSGPVPTPPRPGIRPPAPEGVTPPMPDRGPRPAPNE
jgi:S1-C subfamily serine protease